ncbi:MAG: inorganic phosphate transporter [Rikenellaceae bacterium]|nr:inorganic phosphate transporter [Rikenellaceae bacterium]
MDLFIVITLALLAVMGIVVGVSNDAVNFLNSAFGSKVAKKNVILTVAAVGVMVGVMTSSGMMDVARSGVFYPGMFSYKEIMVLFLGMMLSNIILLDIYNSLGLPTSTTVSLVFGLLGSALALALYNVWGGDTTAISEYINSANALGIVSGILLSVVLAFLTGHLLMYISRIIFSFRYHKIFNRFGALWCGVTLAGIIFFAVFKGLKSSGLIPVELIEYVNNNTFLSLVILWAASSALLWILQRMKVNILRVSILAGTFSLALAFAGNDLVNFIGVPYAGYDSYMLAQEHGTDIASMAALSEPTQANFFIMCAAGLVMVITLFTSKKAMRVIETERKLSSQDETSDTNAEASPISRGIVRASRRMNDGLAAITPNSVKEFINRRFTPLTAEERGDVNYDLIRATVNLTAAAILISIGTQLKLPLSTTYVVFMVSMGSSLADRAWGRESAVYRITGVMTVIMGWFVTAVGGFIIALGVTLALAYGGSVAIIGITILCVILIIKSNIKSKKSDVDVEDEELPTSKIGDTLKRSPEEALIEYTEQVCASMERVTMIYDRTIVAVFKENRKVLKDMVRESEEFFQSTRQQKYDIMPLLRDLKDSDVSTGHYYVQVVDYISETSKALLHITRPCYKHIDNNHTGLNKEQVYDLKRINDRVEEIFGEINTMLRTRSFDNMENVMTKRDELFDFIDEVMQNQLRRLRDTGGSSSANMLFFNILTETKTMILHSRNIMKSLEHFVVTE